MKQKIAVLILLILLASLLSGCWSRRELNDLAIVVGMGIDKAGDQFELTVQIVDPGEISKKQGGGGNAPVTVYSSKGKTLADAIRSLTAVTPRMTYFAHLRILVLSEELAREGIGETLDFLSRFYEFRTDFYISIAREVPAKQILTVMTAIVKIPANKLYSSLKVAEEEWSPVATVKLDQLINDVIAEGKNPVLTGLRIQGNVEKATTKQNVEAVKQFGDIQTWGMGVFQQDKLVGWMNEKESKGYTDLTNRLHRTVIGVSCPGGGGQIAVDVIRAKSKIEGRVEDGHPEANVNVHAEANISDVQCRIDLFKTETIAMLEKKVADVLKEHMEASLKKAKSLKTDVFGFGEAIHRAAPQYWKEAGKDWGKHFVDLSVKIEVDLKIRRLGSIGSSPLSKLKEQ